MAATMALRKRFTVDDYYRMVDAGILGERERVELIDGEVVTMSPIGPRHTGCLNAAMKSLVLAAGDEAIVQPQGPVRLDRFNEPQPDIMLLRPREDFYASRHAGPADVLLVIEIADSSLSYDRGRKARLYAAWGVPEYWVADLPHNVMWRHTSPDGNTYRQIESLSRGQSMSPQLLPGCIVPVDVFLIEQQR